MSKWKRGFSCSGDPSSGPITEGPLEVTISDCGDGDCEDEQFEEHVVAENCHSRYISVIKQRRA